MDIVTCRKKFLAIFIMAVVAVAGLFAHTPILYVEDNGDGTVFVQGGFSNGASAAGVQIFIESEETGKILWEGVLPEISEMDLEIPDEPYIIIFDAGPGHVVSKKGPEPEGGFGSSADLVAVDDSSSSPSLEDVNWIPQDTAAVLPDTGTPFVSIIALVIALVNTCLLIVLLKKK